MKKLALASTLVSALALTACNGGGGKSSKSEDKNGNCKSTFISDYNDLVYKQNSLASATRSSSSLFLSRLQSFVDACDDFQKTYSSNSCKAVKISNGNSTHASRDDFKESCKTSRNALAKINNPPPVPDRTSRNNSGSNGNNRNNGTRPEVTPQPRGEITKPGNNVRLVDVAPDSLTISVTNPSRLAQILNTTKHTLDGEILTLDQLRARRTDLRAGKSICTVSSEDSDFWHVGLSFEDAELAISEGGIQEESLAREAQTIFILVSSYNVGGDDVVADSSLVIACTKTADAQKTTLGDIRTSFGDILDFAYSPAVAPTTGSRAD